MSNLSMRCASTERRKINTNATRLVKSNAPTAVTQGGRQRTTSRGRRTPLHIVAARVAGVEIPNAKNVEVSLTYIYGIGPTMAKKIMTNCGVENKRTKDLSEDELTKLRKEVEDGDYLIEGDLRRFTAMNIKRLIEIQCYRGKRHQMSLPVRGQKTKTNARTRKGKKKTVAGKKK
ncbi:plastid ribosomal protein S13 [Chloropicon primus]|nr:plastid ribosomal protein S13 [Chloropicon primus]UPR00900.1 plastid ribosomal protein S13 [Chloropicon primus]|eukprot:QDZ21678.1 plastid ribosomal protein S13 [Chloropicon primus]